MKRTKVLFFTLLFAAMATMPQGAMSQVTIGADQSPQDFSVLELISNSSGLRLPQVKDNERKKLTTQIEAILDPVAKALANGLTIYNTDANCVQYWNGSNWIPAGICGVVIPSVEPPQIVGCTQSIPPVTFMAYNLGAASDTRTVNGVVCNLSTAKGQMLYLANTAYNALDSTVYGAWYQWGRQTDGHQKRNSIAVALSGLSDGDYSNNNGTGQITDATYKSQFITNSNGSLDWQKTHVDLSDLWGNGELIGTETTGSGVICDGCSPAEANGKYFQSTTWAKPENNPCPSGFRVPTQDEWERIANYDCHPNVPANYFSTSNSATSLANNLTWVPVVCGTGSNITNVKCQANGTAWEDTPTTNATRSGYAIYTTTDWTANSSYVLDLTNPDAKEPLLFLPAAGYRYTSGSQTNAGKLGYYWTSTVFGTNSRNLYFDSELVYPNSRGSYYRASGLSLRCVAE